MNILENSVCKVKCREGRAASETIVFNHLHSLSQVNGRIHSLKLKNLDGAQICQLAQVKLSVREIHLVECPKVTTADLVALVKAWNVTKITAKKFAITEDLDNALKSTIESRASLYKVSYNPEADIDSKRKALVPKFKGMVQQVIENFTVDSAKATEIVFSCTDKEDLKQLFSLSNLRKMAFKKCSYSDNQVIKMIVNELAGKKLNVVFAKLNQTNFETFSQYLTANNIAFKTNDSKTKITIK